MRHLQRGRFLRCFVYLTFDDPSILAVASRDPNGFAGVNYAAPAKREDDIAVGVLRAPRSLADQVDRRLAGHRKGLG